jgi:hypothetical protein
MPKIPYPRQASALREYMVSYAARPHLGMARYTSFVTSSMMGKSRHMKEVANHLPSVYICLRGEDRGYGYPRQSPGLAEWSMKGAVNVYRKSVVDSHSCFSTSRWSAFIISSIKKLATSIDDGRFFTSLGIDEWEGRKLEYAWLWTFFAEPLNDFKLRDFWLEVQTATREMMLKIVDGGGGKYGGDGKSAHAYFQMRHMGDVQNALKHLRRSFASHENDNSLPLILIFDEARTFCGYEAYDGAKIYEEDAMHFESKKPATPRENPVPLRSFSNFRALRRALRYLLVGTTTV